MQVTETLNAGVGSNKTGYGSDILCLKLMWEGPEKRNGKQMAHCYVEPWL